MARAKRAARKSPRKRNARPPAAVGRNAIALLKADHRQVEEWFEQYQSARTDGRKKELAQRISQALKVHTQIEHEIFYPAFLEATGDEQIHHEAEVEHEGAKKLIAAIEESSPEDEYYDARVVVLSEMIKHHVKEEEKRDGMFGKAAQSDMDLDSVGQRLAMRKAELMADGSELAEEETRSPQPPRPSAVPGAFRASIKR